MPKLNIKTEIIKNNSFLIEFDFPNPIIVININGIIKKSPPKIVLNVYIEFKIIIIQ